MATREQIKQHLAQSSNVSTELTKPAKSGEAEKMNKLEHVEKSKGKV